MAELRELLARDDPVLAPGAYGGLSARLVERTVREYEAAGVAALHLEDQVAPKRCGHMDGKDVIDARSPRWPTRSATPRSCSTGSTAARRRRSGSSDEFTGMIGLPELREIEARFVPD